jgi:tetratricopeptide (TPR) repeat protein
MRTTIAALVGAALVASSVGCTKGAPKDPAWTRWGITKPTTEDSAEAKLADAYRWLYALRLDSAQQAYKDLVGRFPHSAEAHLGLSMAYRYFGMRGSALAEARAAFKLDSAATGVLLDYADLILPIRTGPIPDMTDSARYAESDRCNLKAAASDHPFNAHAHVSLWSSYMARGRLSDARHQALELSQKHYYQQPLLDFARNLLVGLAPNAILFTNGDDDTYPPWVLQQAEHPFRPDVTVANVTLLNIPAVVKMMKDSLGLPVSFTAEEIAALAPKSETVGRSLAPPSPPSQQVVENVIANAATAHRPVYFAVTVSSGVTMPFADRLVLEGLVNRVADSTSAAPMDFDRIAENLTKKYRLGWPKTLPPWPANMSPLTRMVAPLGQNYGFLYVQLAFHYDSQGSETKAADAVSKAVAWMVRAGMIAAARDYADKWLARDSGNAVAKRLKAALEKAGAAQ